MESSSKQIDTSETGNYYKEGFLKEEEELDTNEYLGTFRWKKSYTFPLLALNGKFDYRKPLTNWKDYLESRLDQDFAVEPHIIDALSYPLSIIYGLQILKSENKLNLTDKVFNLILLGISQKAEARIALESNYFDEIFLYLLAEKQSLPNNYNNSDFEINIFFVGPEVKISDSYSAKLSSKFKYNFSSLKAGDFLKNNVLDFSKSNTIAIGLNCGFGAGYLKLTYSWAEDLIKLLKLNYQCFFTYTNDFEDLPGETAIVADLLGGKVYRNIIDNPFKCMTTYKNEEENVWSCGNYGLYFINGYDKDKIMKLSKLKEMDLKDAIKKALEAKNVKIK